MDHKLPNLLIVGYHKAGTTTLFHELSRHPDIFPSIVKEPFYFRPYINGKDLPPLEEYARNFAGAEDERYRMEASPTYIYGKQRAAVKIREILGDVKIIISLRNPVEQLFSLYKHHLRFMKIDKEQTFLEFLETKEDFERQVYADHLTDWFHVFGRNMKIIFFEDLIEAPETVINDLIQWLDLEPLTILPDTLINVNPGETYRFRTIHKLALNVFEQTKAYVPHRLFVTLRKVYYRLNGQTIKFDLDEASEAFVRERLAQQNQNLRELLISKGYGDLPDWLKDM